MSKPQGGRVSVIIPARNEEANIARAVRSVAAQEGVREILVVDDQSGDRTGDILEELRAEIPALRTIRIESLPEGWAGKPHALAVGAREAGGEWLLFADADTEHRPGSLAELLARAEGEHAELLSLSPGQRTEAWWEKAVIPLIYVHLARLYPFDQISDPGSHAAAANGQYMLIRRQTYERVGGHAGVRNEILEDVALARRVKSAGGRLVFLPGAAWVETRMYRSFAEMWRGWTKNLYLLFEQRLGCIFKAVAELWLLDFAPTLLFLGLAVLFALGQGGSATILAAVGGFLIAIVRQAGYSRALAQLGFQPSLARYQVPGAGLLGLMLLDSARRYRWGKSIQWKGRHYSTKGLSRGKA